MAPKNQPLTPPVAGWPLQVRRISRPIGNRVLNAPLDRAWASFSSASMISIEILVTRSMMVASTG
jgi:hypothetical protein